jgi:hypothetical protein
MQGRENLLSVFLRCLADKYLYQVYRYHLRYGVLIRTKKLSAVYLKFLICTFLTVLLNIA